MIAMPAQLGIPECVSKSLILPKDYLVEILEFFLGDLSIRETQSRWGRMATDKQLLDY